MKCPINFPDWHWPIKEKYLDEENREFGYWIIFGEYPDGNVDIHWAYGGLDIFNRIPRDKAEKLIQARTDFIQTSLEILNKKRE